MNPEGGFPRMGAPGWQRTNTVDSSFNNARGQTNSYPRFAPPGLSSLSLNTSTSQVPYISSGNYSAGGGMYTSGSGISYSSGGGVPYSSGGGVPYSTGAGHSYSTGAGGHSYNPGAGHSYSSGGGHAYPSGGGHTFSNQTHSSSFSPYGPPLKCADCYALGSELFYFKTQFDIINHKFKTELQQHALCGPKLRNYESKLEEHKQCEPRIHMLQKELEETRVYRDRYRKVENEMEKLRDRCRKHEKELNELKTAPLNNNVFLRQDPDPEVAIGEERKSYDPKLYHIFNENRKSQDNRTVNSRSFHNDGKQSSKFSRGPRHTNEEATQETPRHVRPRIAVKEIEGDLLDMTNEYSLAHCVGSDFMMSSGVAIRFRKQFRCIPELLQQNKSPGEVAFLENSGRFIYYMVTKEFSTGKPKFEDFQKAVTELRKLCEEHDVKKLAIPKIGCGRDQLDWNEVKRLLNEEFSQTSVDITVCVIHQESAPEKRWSLKLMQAQRSITDLDPIECALIFFGSKDNFITPDIQSLSQKYNFKSDYTTQPKTLGGLYHYTARGGDVNIFGFIVKERHSDPFSFTKFNECLLALRRAMRKLRLYYIGFEAFDDPHCPSVTRKIWTALIDCFFTEEYEVHICWPSNIREKPWEERK